MFTITYNNSLLLEITPLYHEQSLNIELLLQMFTYDVLLHFQIKSE